MNQKIEPISHKINRIAYGEYFPGVVNLLDGVQWTQITPSVMYQYFLKVVLELQDNGQLVTSDDPPVVLGCLNAAFIQEAGLHSGNLVRFAVNEGGLTFVDGKLEKADLQYIGKVPRGRAFADSYSKIIFQYMVRHSPLRIEHLFASMGSLSEQESETNEVEMAG